MSILGYDIAKWVTTFDLFKVTLFNTSFKYTYTDESWNKFEAEWTNLAEKHSGEWGWPDESNSTRIPYRLPDKEMNF